MKRMVIVCLLISLVKSQTCQLSSDELSMLKNSLLSSVEFFDKDDENENAAIFLGLARSGKSTLINYLIGTPLKGEKLTYYKITKVDATSKGPTIGSTTLSETTTPTKWKSEKLPDLTLWDAPGFEDNRGTVQDMANAFNIYHLVKCLKNLKIILVCDYANIESDDPEQFLHSLLGIENLLGSKFEDSFSSITLIFSKVPIDKEWVIDQSYITEVLNENYVKSIKLEMTENVRNFLKYLVKHPDRIGFFKKVNKEGIISSSDIDVDIISAIQSSQTINNNILRQVKPSMSENSKLCLSKTQRDLLLNPLYQHVESVNNEIQKAIDFCRLQDNSNELIRIENILQNAVNKASDIVYQFKLLKIINSEVGAMIDRFNMVITIELVEFIDTLWKSDEKNNVNFIGKLQLHSLLEHAKAEMSAKNLKALYKEIDLKREDLEKKTVKYEKILKAREEEVHRQSSSSKSYILVSISAVIGILAVCFFMS